jgi:hypothetical protein
MDPLLVVLPSKFFLRGVTMFKYEYINLSKLVENLPKIVDFLVLILLKIILLHMGVSL